MVDSGLFVLGFFHCPNVAEHAIRGTTPCSLAAKLRSGASWLMAGSSTCLRSGLSEQDAWEGSTSCSVAWPFWGHDLTYETEWTIGSAEWFPQSFFGLTNRKRNNHLQQIQPRPFESDFWSGNATWNWREKLRERFSCASFLFFPSGLFPTHQPHWGFPMAKRWDGQIVKPCGYHSPSFTWRLRI